jgi:hypothetical protein
MRILRPVLVLVALLSSLLVGSTTASAGERGEHGRYTCAGGTLFPLNPSIIPPGRYESIRVTGNCLIPGGEVDVRENVSVGRGAVLVVNLPPTPGGGPPEDDATLIVGGNVSVGKDATLILGCAPSFGCDNFTHSVIKGNLTADGALGMLLHSDTIKGNLSVNGGGGKNYDCVPPTTGLFGVFGSPVYTTFEDGTIGGNATFSDYKSCWLGLARATVGRNLTYSHNILGDADAIEILASTVGRNLSCHGNLLVDVSQTPAVYTLHSPWDSADLSADGSLFPRAPEPNTVGGHRSGQCVLDSPTSASDAPGPGAF